MDECSTNLSHTNGNAGQLDNKGGAHNKDGRIKPRFNWKEWSWRRRVRKNSELNSQGLMQNSVTIAVTEQPDTLKVAEGGPDYPGLRKGEQWNTRIGLVLIGFPGDLAAHPGENPGSQFFGGGADDGRTSRNLLN